MPIDLHNARVYYTHMKSGEVIRLLKADGWYVFNVRGSHHQFKHPSKSGKVTVPHPKADLPIGTAKSIFRQAGLKWEK